MCVIRYRYYPHFSHKDMRYKVITVNLTNIEGLGWKRLIFKVFDTLRKTF